MRIDRNTFAALTLMTFLAAAASGTASTPLAAEASPSDAAAAQAIPDPRGYFGFEPGDDGLLLDYGQLIGYLEVLDRASPRLSLVEAGESPLGRKIYIAFISSAGNIADLEALREINRRLALDPLIPDAERKAMLDGGRVFVLATLSMHSTEVGPSQSAPLIAHRLVTGADPEMLRRLDDVVFMLVPCHNPDGMEMIVEHYRKYRDTKYDGSSMPGVYHKYIGHDNNRDFVTLTQSDTRAISAIYDRTWFPQVMVEKHQMGAAGVRYFVPPNHDPIAENIDAGIWNWIGVFGSNMITDMTRDGCSGVTQHYLFDEYWPGSTGTCNWKNVISMLTEAASAYYATPVYVEPNEIAVYGKGLSEYKKSVNMPLPWPGGWWRLADIVRYEISSTMSMLKTASNHRREILEFRNDLCRREVERGRSEPPFYYIMPLRQRDRSETAALVDLLLEHGVQVSRLTAPVTIADRLYAAGDVVVSLAQPLRAFVKEVMEAQRFPVRRYTPGGEMIRPYDVVSWSLPLHRGVECQEIEERSLALEKALEPIEDGSFYRSALPAAGTGAVFAAENNESYLAAFSAAGTGMPVYRLLEPLEIGDEVYNPGGFVVEGDLARSEPMRRLLGAMRVTPRVIETREGLEAAIAAGGKFKSPRIALVETWFHDMDAGWTRFIFDAYRIPFTVLRPNDFEKTDLAARYDVILFPDVDAEILMSGRVKRGDGYLPSNYPPEYVAGMGKKGLQRLMTFVDRGGIVVAWGRSTGLFEGQLEIPRGKDESEEFELPLRGVSDELRSAGFYAPGSLLRGVFRPDHPLTLGMPREAGVLLRSGIPLRTSLPRFDLDRRVIAVFAARRLLLSGYVEKPEALSERTALAWFRKGKGQFVLFGFNPQFRAATAGTYKLLFNALLLGPAEEVSRAF